MDLRRGARWGAVWLGLALAGPAQARDVPLFSGDVAFTYGRNWQQELNVAGIAGELKLNLLPYLAVGVRTGGALGGGLGREEGARGYAGLPLILKAEATPLATKVRPYVGLGLGVTRVAAGGAVVVLQTDVRNSRSWSITGPMPTLMPEVGIDLGGFRVALLHASLVGSSRATEQAIGPGDYHAPNLSGTVLQLGAHFGGPKG